MNRKVCDLCGKDAPLNGHDSYTYCGDELIVEEKVLADDKAKIRISTNTGFIGHSSGFSGPPDLCPDCFVKCFRLLGEKIIKYADVLNQK